MNGRKFKVNQINRKDKKKPYASDNINSIILICVNHTDKYWYLFAF